MNYLDVYFSRINHMGETTGERIVNGGIRSFQRWKNESPHTVTTLSVERGIYFDGIILSNKDKDYQKIMILNVANDIPIRVGDIMNWQQDNGDLEKWLLIAEEHKVHPTYRSFNIIKCNYLIKWINAKGYIKQSWAYVLSSVDSKIKGNFRTWHNLITPQPNKYAEIIMPRPVDDGSEIADTVDRGINFIIEDESWKMVEADFTSVKGIIYMSLTENKVNLQYDYLGEGTNDIADLDKYKFPELPTLYKIGDTIIPQFEEDTLNQWEIEMRPSNFDLVDEEKEGEGKEEKWYQELHASTAGQCIITMRLKNRHAVEKKVEIIIDEVDKIYHIVGQDKIRLDRKGSYYLTDGTFDNEEHETIVHSYENKGRDKVVISLEILNYPDEKKQPKDYGIITKSPEWEEIPDVFVLRANDKNNLGVITLALNYSTYHWDPSIEGDDKWALSDTKQYTKKVEIIPLW